MSNALANVFSSTLSTEDFYLNNTISISPNPTSGKVFINGKLIEQIEVYNLLGQKISSQNNMVNKNPIFVDLSTFKRGVYFFRIKTNRRITLKKDNLFVIKLLSLLLYYLLILPKIIKKEK